jgi:hypothetical protein
MRTVPRELAILGLFIVLTIIHTWPLALAPANWSRVDNGDYNLNVWALAWVAHQAPRDPLHLFDANIFYPERRTLALSEHLLPQAAFAAPVIWLGGSAVLAHNISMLAGFALSGWAMAFVITRWTGNAYAGALAGSLAAFNAQNLTRLAHIQVQHTMYFPLALLAFDRMLSTRRVRDAIGAGAWIGLQALTSGYWTIFMALSMPVAAISRIAEWSYVGAARRPKPSAADLARPSARPLLLLCLAAATAALLVAPIAYQYWRIQQEQGLVRHAADVTRYSGRWIDYATGASTVHLATPLGWGLEYRRAAHPSFPGVVALILAGITVATGVWWRDRRARMLGATALVAFLLSFGMATPIYRWLYEWLPAMSGLRAPVRFRAVVLLAVAGLAGFGLAWLMRRVESAGWTRRAVVVLGIGAAALVNAEALRAPIRWTAFEGIPPAYYEVERLPDAVLAEVPMYAPRVVFANARYLLPATVHWKPMVNGYSGFTPRSYRRLWRDGMNRFPAPPAAEALRRAGVTHVVVHPERLGRRAAGVLRGMQQSGDFQRVGGDDRRVQIYRLLPDTKSSQELIR